MPVYGTLFEVYCPQNTVSQMYEMEFVRGHVEVYLDGAFCFSADTRGEAERELAEMTA